VVLISGLINFRSALTELSVLGDILAISQQKKYLVLDPVSAETPDSRPAATLMYKKKVIIYLFHRCAEFITIV